MKNSILFLSLLSLSLVVFSFSCKKTSDKTDGPPVINGVTEYAPEPVLKSNTKRVFVHLMPWFETKASNGGSWGIHWKMDTQNPDIIEPNGQRQIAAHFYPLIGPYASGDTAVIQYQLLLMKLSGIDGIFIDWPGTQSKYDYPLLVRNTERIVAQTAKVGLNYAIVYEDQNLVQTADKIGQAKADMAYLQDKYFGDPLYEKISDKPLLLDFGPQAVSSPNDWTTIFSALNPPPSFFTLWFQSGEAGVNAAGEFAWIPQNNLTTLHQFYNNNFSGIKMGVAYPGFYSFYTEGGWGGPTWTIDHNGTGTFIQTLDLALSSPGINYVQLATWNDYGEGTMIEPTKEFSYDFLTVLQQKLGVQSLSEADLKLVGQLYQLRLDHAGQKEVQVKLNQAFYYLVSLQTDKAAALLSTI